MTVNIGATYDNLLQWGCLVLKAWFLWQYSFISFRYSAVVMNCLSSDRDFFILGRMIWEVKTGAIITKTGGGKWDGTAWVPEEVHTIMSLHTRTVQLSCSFALEFCSVECCYSGLTKQPWHLKRKSGIFEVDFSLAEMWCLVLGDERPSCLAQGFKSSGESSQLQSPVFGKAWLIFSLHRFSLWYGMGCWGKRTPLWFMCRVVCVLEMHCSMLVTKIPQLAEMRERAAFWNLLSKSHNVWFLTCGEDVTSVCCHKCCFSLAC